MICDYTRGRILRLHHVEKWLFSTIALALGVHHSTVRRVLAETGVPEALQSPRPSKIDPYVPFIIETLKLHPKLHASRLFVMAKERGYTGKGDHFRHAIALLRPRKPSEAFLRLRTLPGEQAQVDWAHFGSLTVGSAQRKLYGFVMVLSWSRKIFLRFGFDIGMAGFLMGHAEALQRFGGVPRVLLYDNLKSAVVERIGDAIRFHPQLLGMAAHYLYDPRPVQVARGNQKGRVERAIRYIRGAFFAGRTFKDITDLNAQADAWCANEAAERKCPGDPLLTIAECFELEVPYLRKLPDNPWPSEQRVEVSVGKTPYVRFDRNDYSVPHDLVQRQLTVFADVTTVRIVSGTKLVAEHPRTFDKGQQVEDRSHIARLLAFKRSASLHHSQDQLLRAVPVATQLLAALAKRGANLGSATAALLRLLSHYGATALTAAIEQTLATPAPNDRTVRQILEARNQRLPRGARI